ncbi:MAG TPA: biopolymer transporter ExbD [Verrucomicrobiae bacterium]|nr:biopolymer transporter ExbD [Verrucomicrobiae bacterium]
MSLKKTTRRGHGTMTELNITPLLDLVFVLLVIFIITTPQLMNNLEINLPSGKPPQQKPKVEPTRIEVSGQGQITLDQKPVTATELKEKLATLKAADPELGVVVKGADDTDYQIMVGVLDTLRQLDITKMGMATD